MDMNQYGVAMGMGRWLRIGFFLTALTATGLDSLTSWAAEAHQAEAEVLVAQGVIAYDDHRYDDALRLLTRARELNSRDSRGLYYLGLTQLARKNPVEAISALEAASQLQPSDTTITYQLGIAYFTAGRYDDAAPLLEQAFKADPTSENLGYYVGLGRYRQKNYKEAVEAFKANQSGDVSVQQLTQFYRGLALGVLGLPEQATVELRQLEATGSNLPFTGQALQIQQALASRQRVDEPQRLRLQMSVGGFYSDNVAINPRNLGTTPDATTNEILRNLHGRKTTAPGFLGSVNASYSFLRHGPFEAMVNYSFLQTLNFTDGLSAYHRTLNFEGLSTFNIQSHLPGIGAFYRGTLANIPFQLAAQYTYNYIFLNETGFTSSHSPTGTVSVVPPSFTLPLLGRVDNLTSAITRWQKKDFFNERLGDDPRFPGEQRDAYNLMFGFAHAFRFAQDRHIIRFGYQWDNESSAGAAFSYKGHRGQAGVQTTLPVGGLIARYDYDIHFRDYKNSQLTFRDFDGQLSARVDTQQTHSAQLIYPISNHWSVTAQYQRVQNKSNVPLYDYVQNVWTGLVTWTY